jgi:chromosome segregation ATPase
LSQDTIQSEVERLTQQHKDRSSLSKAVAGLLFFQHGLRPTVQLIHSYTRRGSLTDISKDLKEFWESLRQQSALTLDVSPEFKTQAASLLMQIWQVAKQQADQQFEAAEQSHHQQLQQHEVERQAWEQQNQSLERTLTELREAHQQQAEQLTQHKEVLMQQVATIAAEREALQAALQDAQQQTDHERQAREATENKFLQELEQERQLRSRSEEHLRGEVRFAKMQIEESRVLVRHLQERINTLEADRRLIEGQLRQQLTSVRDEVTAQLSLNAEQRGREQALNAQLTELKHNVKDTHQQASHWQAQCAALELKLQRLDLENPSKNLKR